MITLVMKERLKNKYKLKEKENVFKYTRISTRNRGW